jgi:hypothetical protein
MGYRGRWRMVYERAASGRSAIASLAGTPGRESTDWDCGPRGRSPWLGRRAGVVCVESHTWARGTEPSRAPPSRARAPRGARGGLRARGARARRAGLGPRGRTPATRRTRGPICELREPPNAGGPCVPTGPAARVCAECECALRSCEVMTAKPRRQRAPIYLPRVSVVRGAERERERDRPAPRPRGAARPRPRAARSTRS